MICTKILTKDGRSPFAGDLPWPTAPYEAGPIVLIYAPDGWVGGVNGIYVSRGDRTPPSPYRDKPGTLESCGAFDPAIHRIVLVEATRVEEKPDPVAASVRRLPYEEACREWSEKPWDHPLKEEVARIVLPLIAETVQAPLRPEHARLVMTADAWGRLTSWIEEQSR